MTWLVPWALAAAGGAAALVGLLHLLARDRPPRWLLPTARFVRAGTARATRRARTPRDRRLLALRMLALLLAGAGFAAPVRDPAGGSIARVVLLEKPSPGVGADSAFNATRERLKPGDRLVVFDTMAAVIIAGAEGAALDSLAGGIAADSMSVAAPHPPRLSAALVAGARIAGEVAASVDSVEMIVVSTLRGVEDAATREIRALWPGRIELVQVPALTGDTITRPLHVRGAAADPVVAGARLAGAAMAAGDIAPGATLIVRDSVRASDAAFARSGGTLVVWPAGSQRAAEIPSADTTSGIVVEGAVVPFVALRRGRPPAGRVVARWVDGEPAATQLPHGAGCIRTVSVDLPAAGDLTLRPGFQRALRGLALPCAGQPRPIVSDSMRAILAGSGALASAAMLRRDVSRSPATPWLLGAALVLLLLEPALRRTARSAAGEQGDVA